MVRAIRVARGVVAGAALVLLFWIPVFTLGYLLVHDLTLGLYVIVVALVAAFVVFLGQESGEDEHDSD